VSQKAQQRAELQRRAEERVEAEDARLREEAAAARKEERDSKHSALHNLSLQVRGVLGAGRRVLRCGGGRALKSWQWLTQSNSTPTVSHPPPMPAQADIKSLELRVAKRIAHRQQLAGYCLTTAQPQLRWVPAKASAATDAQLQVAAAELEAWKQQQLEQLEQDKAALQAAAVARRESLLARMATRQAGGEGANGDGGVGAAGSGDDEVGEDAAAAAGGEGDDADMQEAGDAAAGGDGDEQEQQQEEEQEEEEVDGELARARAEQAEEQAARRRRRQRAAAGEDEDEEERLLSSDEDE
jgi:hypothetical protein